jgi:hypothetical protein
MHEADSPFSNPDHLHNRRLRYHWERLEVAYLKAKRKGLRDPVVVLCPHEEVDTIDDPVVRLEAIEHDVLADYWAVGEREEVCDWFQERFPPVAERLRVPNPEMPFTVVIMSPHGTTLYDNIAPSEE